jgi:hypothetical protein
MTEMRNPKHKIRQLVSVSISLNQNTPMQTEIAVGREAASGNEIVEFPAFAAKQNNTKPVDQHAPFKIKKFYKLFFSSSANILLST